METMYTSFRDSQNVIVADLNHVLTTDKHYHNCIELIYVIEGKAIAYIDEKEYSLNAGEMIAISSFAVHYYKSYDGGKYLIILIPHRYFSSAEPLLSKNSFTNPVIRDSKNREFFTLLDFLYKIKHGESIIKNDFSESPSDSEFALQNLASFILHFCISSCKLSPKKNVSAVVPQILEIIETSFREELSVNKISALLYCDADILASQFKNATGTTITQYILRTRLLESAKLLMNCPTMPIERVAYNCGFKSMRSFFRNFKQLYGCTPKEFRNDRMSP